MEPGSGSQSGAGCLVKRGRAEGHKPQAGPRVAEAGWHQSADFGPCGHQASLAPKLTVALDLKIKFEHRAVGRIYFRLGLDGVQPLILRLWSKSYHGCRRCLDEKRMQKRANRRGWPVAARLEAGVALIFGEPGSGSQSGAGCLVKRGRAEGHKPQAGPRVAEAVASISRFRSLWATVVLRGRARQSMSL